MSGKLQDNVGLDSRGRGWQDSIWTGDKRSSPSHHSLAHEPGGARTPTPALPPRSSALCCDTLMSSLSLVFYLEPAGPGASPLTFPSPRMADPPGPSGRSLFSEWRETDNRPTSSVTPHVLIKSWVQTVCLRVGSFLFSMFLELTGRDDTERKSKRKMFDIRENYLTDFQEIFFEGWGMTQRITHYL